MGALGRLASPPSRLQSRFQPHNPQILSVRNTFCLWREGLTTTGSGRRAAVPGALLSLSAGRGAVALSIPSSETLSGLRQPCQVQLRVRKALCCRAPPTKKETCGRGGKGDCSPLGFPWPELLENTLSDPNLEHCIVSNDTAVGCFAEYLLQLRPSPSWE